MTKFAVIQTRLESIPHDLLVGVLTQAGKLTHPDATQAVRRCQGIVWQNFERQHAEAVCQRLADEGFAVAMLPRDEIPELGEPRAVRWFELDPEELRIPKGIRGETVPIPWPSVMVLNYGQVAEVSKREVPEVPRMASSSPSGMAIARDQRPHYTKQSTLIDVLDLVGIDGDGCIHYLRMPSNELAYGRIMGDGTNLSRFERFLVIVEYCVHHAARAIVSAQTRKVLVDRRPSDHHFEGEGMHEIQEEVLDSRNRWLLLRAIKGEQLKAATVPGRPGRASDAEANTRSAPSSEAE